MVKASGVIGYHPGYRREDDCERAQARISHGHLADPGHPRADRGHHDIAASQLDVERATTHRLRLRFEEGRIGESISFS